MKRTLLLAAVTSAALVQPFAAQANAAPADSGVSAAASYCSKAKKPYNVHVWACAYNDGNAKKGHVGWKNGSRYTKSIWVGAYYRIKGKGWKRCYGRHLQLDSGKSYYIKCSLKWTRKYEVKGFVNFTGDPADNHWVYRSYGR